LCVCVCVCVSVYVYVRVYVCGAGDSNTCKCFVHRSKDDDVHICNSLLCVVFLLAYYRTDSMPITRACRFCSRCWIKCKRWTLRSIKLPSGQLLNLHGHTSDTCPQWTVADVEPTTEASRAYGTAFKQLQRSSHIHEVAMNDLTVAQPGLNPYELDAYLREYMVSADNT